MRIPKPVRNFVLSTLILVAVFATAGVIYTYFTGGGPVKTSSKPASSAQAVSTPRELKPTPPAPNAPVGAAVESISSPVKAGSNASLIVKTTPKAMCSVLVTIGGVPSKDSGLAPKTADAYGLVTWTWTVGASESVGNWPAKATCTYRGRSGVVQTSFKVTN